MRISLVASVLVASLAFTSSAAATSYTVNSNADPAGECAANGQLTLREAVQAANSDTACGDAPAGGATDAITFSLPQGSRVIALKETLRVTARLSLDGAGVVELVGDGAGQAGIGVELFRHLGSTVRGLTLRGFGRSGIEVTCFAFTDIPCGSHVISGNRIGTDVTGTLARPNGFGVFVHGGFHSVIGGGSQSERNIISGNTSIGVYLLAGATLNRVEGNYIGVAADGITALPNRGEAGVVIGGGVENVIGGDLAHGNVIAGNTRIQLAVYGNGADASYNAIQGNLIGVGADGITPIEGGSAAFPDMPAVDLSGDVGMRAYYTTVGGDPAHRNVIGNQGFRGDGIRIGSYAEGTILRANFIGVSASRAVGFGHAGCGVSVLAGSSITYLGSEGEHGTNVIARNGRGGVCVHGGTGARIFREEILENHGPGVRVFPGAVVEIVETVLRGNSGLGIDIAGAGVTAGAPAITRAEPNEVELRVMGEANASVLVELFLATDPADESGHGEASTFLGKVEGFTSSSGEDTVTITPLRALLPGERVTATATFAGATSEHAANFTVPGGAPSMDAGAPVDDAGSPSDDASTHAPDDAGVDAAANADASEADDAGVMARKHGGCSAGGGGGGAGGVIGIVMVMLAVWRGARPPRRFEDSRRGQP